MGFQEGEYLATVEDDYANGTVLVVFDDDFPDEEVEYGRLREMDSPSKPKPTSSIPGFFKGDRVTVHYSDGKDYPARVVRITSSGKYEVQFDAFDDPEEIILDDLSPLHEEAVQVEDNSLKENQRVNIKYEDGNIYSGTILETREEDRYFVKFDDDFPDEELD